MIYWMITSCKKYAHKLEKYYAYEEENKGTLDWCRIKFVYIMGGEKDPNLPKVTFLDVGDGYEDLPKKVIEGVRYIYENLPDVQGIFKMDDDVDINYHSMRFIHFLWWIPYWGLKVGHLMYDGFVHKETYEKCAAKNLPVIPLQRAIHTLGYAYYINRHCIEIALRCRDRFYNTYNEDMMMGRVLNESMMFPVELNELLKDHFVLQD